MTTNRHITVNKDGMTITTSTGATQSYNVDAFTNWLNDFSQSIQNINIPNFDTYIKGIWKTDDTDTKGNEDIMENQILDLYFRRTRERINKEYDEKRLNAYNELPVVKEYNEVVKEFEATLAEMADRYNTEETKVLRKSGYSSEYTYELRVDIDEVVEEELRQKHDNDLKELDLLRQEVEAQLSLSNDKDYQIEVLKNYEILDKKTGKINA